LHGKQVVAYKNFEQENEHFSKKNLLKLCSVKTLIFFKSLLTLAWVFEYLPLGNFRSLFLKLLILGFSLDANVQYNYDKWVMKLIKPKHFPKLLCY